MSPEVPTTADLHDWCGLTSPVPDVHVLPDGSLPVRSMLLPGDRTALGDDTD